MPRTTGKAERAALHKKRRKIRLKMKAHQKSKRKQLRLKKDMRTHPHRRTAALRQRSAKP